MGLFNKWASDAPPVSDAQLPPCDHASGLAGLLKFALWVSSEYLSRMTIWIVFAIMTAATAGALLWPLGRQGKTAPSRTSFGQQVYRDQLAELDRDVARGAIGADDASAARNEIARRLIAESGEAAQSPAAPSPRAAWFVMAIIPAIALPLYWQFGSPSLRDVPLASRLENAVANNDFAALVAKVESHIAANPNDAKGWMVLANAYERMERYGDAASAYASIIRLSKPEAGLYADYGRMLVLADDGLVSADAARAFAEALRLDPKHQAARFFYGLALKQEGKTGEALALWKGLLADAPGDAPWRGGLEREIAALTGVNAPALTQEQMAAGEQMSSADRDRMIRSMVDGLELRLRANGDDIVGWQRLIRARIVLGEMERAREAYNRARSHFTGKPEALTTLAALARELRIE
jgi:cytochrome c-type biogenesis protein CcmH